MIYRAVWDYLCPMCLKASRLDLGLTSSALAPLFLRSHQAAVRPGAWVSGRGLEIRWLARGQYPRL